MTAVFLIGAAVFAVTTAIALRVRTLSKGLLVALAVGSTFLATVANEAPSFAAAKPVAQAKLHISGTNRSGVVGTSITVHTTGGSGSGVVHFKVTGKGCSIGSTSGVLKATEAGTCKVTATKAATAKYKIVTSTPATFTFVIIGGPDSPTYATPDKASLVTTSWSSTGLAGTGPANDTTNGLNWFISTYYSSADRWLYAYAAPGATVTLTWVVTGSNGQLIPNAPVTLQTQFAPGSNNGKGDTDATFTSPDMVNGNISGVTNGLGRVSFTFTNTNGSANSAPTGWNSTMVSGAPNIATGTTVADVAAETLEAGSGYSWTRMVLQVGSDTFTGDPAPAKVNQATDLVDIIVATNLN